MIGQMRGIGDNGGHSAVALRAARRADPRADAWADAWADPWTGRVEPVAPVARMATAGFDRNAAFLVQLIAMRDGLPQARERRRAAPAEAMRAYSEAARRDDAFAADYDAVV